MSEKRNMNGRDLNIGHAGCLQLSLTYPLDKFLILTNIVRYV